MEILSPAGNYDSLVAAVRTGADAVYLGLKDFSARRNAENFDLSGLKHACEYCHERNVKVYVAINTMIKESEVSLALKCAKEAYNSGADALIVSDIGFVSVLHKILPQIELHASTQMTVHSSFALDMLKSLGIKRVVLGREMSREEIKEFCSQAKKQAIETEVFIHGALCMSVSGKCLMSAVLGGRSGNRGLCAGPCRLEFSSSGKGRYDLSLKDLSLIPYLPELKELGVSSVKIEGRMKRPEYVAAATCAARAAIDGKQDENLNAALKNVFSRSGFTDGYYTGFLGKNMFGVRTKEDAESEKSALLYLHSLYRNERQSVPIKISAEINKNFTSVTVKDREGNCVTVTGAPGTAAENGGVTESFVLSSLCRLGGTPYFAENANATVQSGLYLSASDLNGLRRSAIEKLGEKRRTVCRAVSLEYASVYPETLHPEKTKIFAKFSSALNLPENLSGADGVILPVFSNFSAVPQGVIKIAELPRYILDEQKLTDRLLKLKEAGVHTAYCDNLQALALAKKSGFNTVTSNGLNCANRLSIATLKSFGADMVTLSAETNMQEGKALAGEGNVGLFAYGRLPLMLTRNCPVKNTRSCKDCNKKGALTDRYGVKFPVVCSNGYSEVLNSLPVYLADKHKDLSAFDFLILNFTDEPPETVQELINGYRFGSKPPAEFTRGMYYKNIL